MDKERRNITYWGIHFTKLGYANLRGQIYMYLVSISLA